MIAVAVCVLLGGVLGGCGSGGPSASQKVCDDRAALNSEVSTVITSLRSGNFGEARTHVAGVSEAFTQLEKSAQALRAEQSQALRPAIAEMTNTIAELKSSRSLTDLGTNLDTLGTQVRNLTTQIADTLKCS
ncbi:MAG: hypothetical protein FWD59_10070 [Micrococcales bacterium]|nr:hypothetical protein [Micrococcales bacterium]